MESRYEKKKLFITEEEQSVIKNTPILLAGNNIGVIAECVLRLGFEKITIINDENVQPYHLSNENYTFDDISTPQSASISKRLQAINPDAVITIHHYSVDKNNAEKLIEGHAIAINTLCFSSDTPFIFDEVCQQYNIPVLHPCSLVWGGLVTIVMPDGLSLKTIVRNGEKFNELNIIEYASSYSKFWLEPQPWLDEIIEKHKTEKQQISNTQLPISSWIIAGMCTHLLYKIATKKNVKQFPEFYLTKSIT